MKYRVNETTDGQNRGVMFDSKEIYTGNQLKLKNNYIFNIDTLIKDKNEIIITNTNYVIKLVEGV